MIAYLDTSSLVKLYVEEAGAEAVRRLVKEATVVTTASVAYAEMRAVLARLKREGAIRESALLDLRKQFEMDWPTVLVLPLSPAISAAAGDLAERLGLRGFDAIHLASFAHVLTRAGDEDVEFSSFDDRLTTAAKTLG